MENRQDNEHDFTSKHTAVHIILFICEKKINQHTPSTQIDSFEAKS